uniref:Glutamate-1-semialdehyde 2,1-aminomutase n=1 Tax=Quercus lobata TaxID=97700 RepID=A0A7N2MXQ7_QUELO
MVRFVNSGTECMGVIRLARAFTDKERIIKFEGCYHGHADPFLVKVGSGVATLGLPDSPGVPKGATYETLTAPFNDISAVEYLFETNKGEIAAMILEPVVGNSGFIAPKPEFLNAIRKITKEIVGAYGGRREIMEMVAPAGPMYQAGTLSGNPLAMTAGIHTLKRLQEPGSYIYLNKITGELVQGIIDTGEKGRACDVQGMLEEGVYLAPPKFEAGSTGLVHSPEHIQKTIAAAEGLQPIYCGNGNSCIYSL